MNNLEQEQFDFLRKLISMDNREKQDSAEGDSRYDTYDKETGESQT